MGSGDFPQADKENFTIDLCRNRKNVPVRVRVLHLPSKLWSYPLVKNSIALAARSGVLSSPCRMEGKISTLNICVSAGLEFGGSHLSLGILPQAAQQHAVRFGHERQQVLPGRWFVVQFQIVMECAFFVTCGCKRK